MDLEVDSLLADMGAALKVLLAQRGITDPLMVGIHTGGAWVARQLHSQLSLAEPLSTLDIAFYRDGFSRLGMQPTVRPSDLPLSVDDRHTILVDDVLYTGRTIRAALNELFDYGRPASVILAALIERDGRELPIQADILGRQVNLKAHEHIELSGPDPLRLDILTKGA